VAKRKPKAKPLSPAAPKKPKRRPSDEEDMLVISDGRGDLPAEEDEEPGDLDTVQTEDDEDEDEESEEELDLDEERDAS
jgi:hypothetical protein